MRELGHRGGEGCDFDGGVNVECVRSVRSCFGFRALCCLLLFYVVRVFASLSFLPNG